MPDTVKIPGVGPVKKQYAYAGGFAVVAIVIFAYWRRTVVPDTTTTDTTTTDTTTQGDIGDTTGAYDYSSPGTMGYGYDGSTIPSGYTTQNYGDLVDAIKEALGAPTDNNGDFTTNNDWADAATGVLTNLGVSQVDAYTAISKVLAGLGVTTQQQSWFLQAKGVLGDPPKGYPTLHLLDSGAQPQTPTADKTPPPAVKNLKAVPFREHVDLDWDPVPGVQGYTIWADGIRKTSNYYSTEHVWNLKPNSTHVLEVAAFKVVDGDYIYGPRASITTKTKK